MNLLYGVFATHTGVAGERSPVVVFFSLLLSRQLLSCNYKRTNKQQVLNVHLSFSGVCPKCPSKETCATQFFFFFTNAVLIWGTTVMSPALIVNILIPEKCATGVDHTGTTIPSCSTSVLVPLSQCNPVQVVPYIQSASAALSSLQNSVLTTRLCRCQITHPARHLPFHFLFSFFLLGSFALSSARSSQSRSLPVHLRQWATFPLASFYILTLFFCLLQPLFALLIEVAEFSSPNPLPPPPLVALQPPLLF